MLIHVDYQLWSEQEKLPLKGQLNETEILQEHGLLPSPGDLVQLEGQYGTGVYRVKSRLFTYWKSREASELFVNIVVDEATPVEQKRHITSS